MQWANATGNNQMQWANATGNNQMQWANATGNNQMQRATTNTTTDCQHINGNPHQQQTPIVDNNSKLQQLTKGNMQRATGNRHLIPTTNRWATNYNQANAMGKCNRQRPNATGNNQHNN
jgi:hypothetical protein